MNKKSSPAIETPATVISAEGSERRIGPYRIVTEIAVGMAHLYKAEQEHPRRMVALKMPTGGKLMTQEDRQRFLREIRATTGVDHPGVVPILDAGETPDGLPYYTMPWIEGVSLREKMKDLERLEAQRLLGELCEVVAAIHRAGYVHRDLKPENVMIDHHGRVRLLDFGLAKAYTAADGDGRISAAGVRLGTPHYMAPEQAGGGDTITPAADVYSLGVILREIGTGNRRLLDDCLAREPHARPPDADALLAAWRRPSGRLWPWLLVIVGATLLALAWILR